MEQEKLLLGVLAGLGVAVPMLVWARFWPGPLTQLAKWNPRVPFTRLQWRPFSPNWITVWSAVVALIGFFGVFLWRPVAGIAVTGFGGLLDNWDGSIARALKRTLSKPSEWQWRPCGRRLIAPMIEDGRGRAVYTKDRSRFGRFWLEMNFAGGTDLGKVLDPFCDKVKIMAMLAYFAAAGAVSWPLVLLLAVPEALNTLTRRPFRLFRRWTCEDARATTAGKAKHVFQWLVIVAAGLFHVGWLNDLAAHPLWQHLPDALLAASVFLAFMSVFTRLRLPART